mgnify:CR=1 FL=1
MIRPAAISDALAIAQVHVDTWRATFKGIVPQAYLDAMAYDERGAMWHRTLSEPKASSTFVAVEDDRVVGFAGCGPVRQPIGECVGELYALYVSPEAQGRSHGRHLYEACLSNLRKRSLTPGVVWVFPSNPAVQFYEKMGGVKSFDHSISIGGETLAEIGLLVA